MKREGYSSDEIAATLAKLRDWRYVDDRSYASAFARSATERKHLGPARIIRALRERGVSDALVEEAVAEVFPEGEHQALEEALARFRRKEGRRWTVEQQKARAYRHLLRRGFSPAAIFDVLGTTELIQENED